MLSSDYKLIPAINTLEWTAALNLCGDYDIYHLPGYHLIASQQGGGDPYLFYFQQKNHYAAFPFMVRPVCEVDGLKDVNYKDATSVYGYPGIVSSLDENHPDSLSFRNGFQNALLKALKNLDIISFFSRLNPLISTHWILQGLAEVRDIGPTVTLDLTQTKEELVKGMDHGTRYRIRKAKKNGVTVFEDSSFEHLNKFCEVYNETMVRNKATKYYFFSNNYYAQLIDHLGKNVKLFFAKLNDEIFCGSLFFTNGKIIQYHLSGSYSQHLKYSGQKVIIEHVCMWGKENNFSWLHLGGGLGAKQDTLLESKLGFAKTCRTFKIMEMIVCTERYQELLQKKQAWEKSNNYLPVDENYFPGYRRTVK